jgi:hypothetical protein
MILRHLFQTCMISCSPELPLGGRDINMLDLQAKATYIYPIWEDFSVKLVPDVIVCSLVLVLIDDDDDPY